MVRRYNLENDLKHNSTSLLGKLHEINQDSPSADGLYSLSELAYLAGKRTEPMSRQRALHLHGIAAINATGNAQDNVLIGNSGNNVLKGLAGNDTYTVGNGDTAGLHNAAYDFNDEAIAHGISYWVRLAEQRLGA